MITAATAVGCLSVSEPSMPVGHAFISYVREDSSHVDQLQRALEAAGIPVWRDTASLWPGEDWRVNIRRAITNDALAFIACFSRQSWSRDKSFQNEELIVAIDQLRLRRPDVPWLIPVRFDDCAIPDRDLGGGRTLASIQTADLFGEHIADGTARLVTAVLQILKRASIPTASHRTGAASIGQARVEVNIAAPDATDADFGSVRSVVYVKTSEPISDLTACYVTDHVNGGTTGLGHAPFHISTSQWRIRSEFLLRSVQDVIIGYTTIVHERKTQRFQWDGYDCEYDWTAAGADGSHLSALLQIRRNNLNGQGVRREASHSGPDAALPV
jgi:TIR domain